MKTQIKFRHLVLTSAAIALSVSALAHAADGDASAHVSFWSKVRAVFSPKAKKPAPVAPVSQPAPVAQAPRPPLTKLLRYEISLGASDSCSQIQDQMQSALTDRAGENQVQLATPISVVCTESAATYEGTSYRTATVEITYDYVPASQWNSRAPEFNTDVLGGQPGIYGQPDGKWGVFPTYQACLDSAAKLVPNFSTATGATPVAYLCEAAIYGTTVADPTKPAAAPSGSYALAIYSSGKQTQHLYVYESPGYLFANIANTSAELKVIADLMTQAGTPVVYQDDGIHLAYFAPMNVSIQVASAGRTATSQECTDQLQAAQQVWANLGATGAKAICEQQWADEHTLVVISLGSKYIMPAAGNTMEYNSYADCMSSSEQALVAKAYGSSHQQGVLCFPDQDRKGYYQAQMYWN